MKHSPQWLLAAGLLAAGGLLQGVATALFWRPCAGAMLTGSILRGFQSDPDTTWACGVAMDQHPGFILAQPGAGFTLMGSLGSASALLLALAWLVLLPALPVQRSARLVAAIPGVLGIALALQSVAWSVDALATPDSADRSLMLLMDLTVALALVVLKVNGIVGRLLARLALVLVAATAPGFLHQVVEYVIAVALSEADWDSPPGTGYFTVAMCLLAAVVTVGLWWSGARRTSRTPQSVG